MEEVKVSGEVVEANTELGGHFWQAHEALPQVNADNLFDIGPFTVANSTMFSFLTIILFIIVIFYAKRFSLIPNSFQNLIEMFYEALLGLIIQIVGDRHRAEKIMPIVGSVFTYILLSNLLMMIPGLSSITYHSAIGEVPLLRGGTADFNTTFGLALAAVLIIQYVGIQERGVLGHMGHFIQLGGMIGAFRGHKSFATRAGEFGNGLIMFFVGLIEIIGEFAKIISLSLRLFGNMFAHEILTIIIMGSFAIVVPVIWMGMGLLVGVVQAIVFTSLITVYYSLVLKSSH